MHIPKDIVDLIIDQLASRSRVKRRRNLQAASLVSTRWVNRYQRHRFSTIVFPDKRSLQEWCSRTRLDSDGFPDTSVLCSSLERGRSRCWKPRNSKPHAVTSRHFGISRSWRCSTSTLTAHPSKLSLPSSLRSPVLSNDFSGFRAMTLPVIPGQQFPPSSTFCQTL